VAKPLGGVIRSYLIVMAMLTTFLLGLGVLVAVERLLIG
jgi:hypothetical protein